MKINKKIILIIIIAIILVISCVVLLLYYKSKKSNKEENAEVNEISENVIQDYLNTKENSVMYKDNATLEELKEEYKITGEDELYFIETESDGRKVINVKPDIDYKVAFCGMVNGEMPNLKDINKIYNFFFFLKNGIWININDREKIVNYLNNNSKLKAEYEVDQEGYLKITKTEDLSSTDEVIRKIIEGNKQYVLSISSKCYMVDVVTGKIVENRYNDLEEYQTYEYFQDGDKIIIFISENLENRMTNDEIFDSLIELAKQL